MTFPNYVESLADAIRLATDCKKATVVIKYDSIDGYQCAMAYSFANTTNVGTVVAFIEASGEVTERQFDTKNLIEGVEVTG